MPTLVVSYPVLTNPADKTQIETNFGEVEAAVNNLDDSNLAASANIATSKLAGRDYEFLVHLAGTIDGVPTARAASATEPFAVVPLPGTSTEEGEYTIISGSYYITDCGTANTTFDVRWSKATGGVWDVVPISTPVNAEVIVPVIADTHQSGSLTVDTAALALAAADQYCLALFITTLGAGALSTAYSGLYVTLKIRRTAGLRSF